MDIDFFRFPRIVIPKIDIPKNGKSTYFYEKIVNENIVNQDNKTIIEKDIYENDNGKINKKHCEKVLGKEAPKLLENKSIKKYKINKY